MFLSKSWIVTNTAEHTLPPVLECENNYSILVFTLDTVTLLDFYYSIPQCLPKLCLLSALITSLARSKAMFSLQKLGALWKTQHKLFLFPQEESGPFGQFKKETDPTVFCNVSNNDH